MFELTYNPTFIYDNGNVETRCEVIRTETFKTLKETTDRMKEIREQNNDSLQNDRENVTIVYTNIQFNIID